MNSLGKIAVSCIFVAALCAIALGLMPIGVHEGWWDRFTAISLMESLCAAGYALLALAIVAVLVESRKSPTS